MLLLVGCNPYRISKIYDLGMYEGMGTRGSGISKTKCEQVFSRPQTDGFIYAIYFESSVANIAQQKAEQYWQEPMVNYIGTRLKEICMYQKELRKDINTEKLTDNMLIALADTLITNNYKNSVIFSCSETNKLSPSANTVYYSYNVTEYLYKQFVDDLRSLANKPERLPTGINTDKVLEIASVVEQLAEPLGEHKWLHLHDIKNK